MADNEILAAINDVGKSVVAMEKQLKTCCTREDMANMTQEIRSEVRDNSKRIDRLFELRKEDGQHLYKTVEKIVSQQIASKSHTAVNNASMTPAEEALQSSYLASRRSVRLWPIAAAADTEKQVRIFLQSVLNMPDVMAQSIKIESVQRTVQPRRSRITGEVLVRFTNSQDRDTVQSYSANLAGSEGKAGLRIDVPDHLRGIFRQFETHAARLKQKYGSVKRAIRFDDVRQGFSMDVKLESTGWHRITQEDIAKITKRCGRDVPAPAGLAGPSATDREGERKKILLSEMGMTEGDPVIIDTDDEERPE